jgi:8-oxo-dGTP diphosphatase
MEDYLIKYVCGFAFYTDLESPDLLSPIVILMMKTKPEWQSGKLNGVGGKVELEETFLEAMTREFEEETGIQTIPASWTHFATMRKANVYECQFFSSRNQQFMNAHTMEFETIQHIKIVELNTHDTVDGLSWLIPLAIFFPLRSKNPVVFEEI